MTSRGCNQRVTPSGTPILFSVERRPRRHKRQRVDMQGKGANDMEVRYHIVEAYPYSGKEDR